VWGEFRLARAGAKSRRPARSEQSPAKKFSFPFRRKRNRAQNKKLRRKLFCGTASEASGGGAERSKFGVRIFVKESSDFVQQTPPKRVFHSKNSFWCLSSEFLFFSDILA